MKAEALSRILWIMTIGFVALKLVGAIQWSWWLVLSPILIPTAIVVLIIIGVAMWMK